MHAYVCNVLSCVCARKRVFFLFTGDWKSQLCNLNHSHTPSLSHSSLSFTRRLSVCLSFSSRPSLTHSVSFLLAKFHTTCPRQSRFTDYHPLNAKHITRTHVDGKLHSDTRTHTHTLPGMQCHAGCPLYVWAHPVCLSPHGSSGTWPRFIHRERVRQGRELV